MSAQNQIVLRSDGVVEAQGFRPAYNLAAASQTVFWLQTLLQKINEADQEFRRLTADGQLVGQERFQLAARLDDALNHLLAMRARLESASAFDCTDLRHEFRLHLRLEGGRWHGLGQLGPQRHMQEHDIGRWLKVMRSARLKQLVRLYGLALADGRIDEMEHAALARTLDRLIFAFLLVHHSLQSGEIG
ncbi:MAG: hypothetical protein K1X75_06370 [Leptospirales bacterium]|nr:hypothetical protein [Leptospirales bacterium]